MSGGSSPVGPPYQHINGSADDLYGTISAMPADRGKNELPESKLPWGEKEQNMRWICRSSFTVGCSDHGRVVEGGVHH